MQDIHSLVSCWTVFQFNIMGDVFQFNVMGDVFQFNVMGDVNHVTAQARCKRVSSLMMQGIT
jgi:hypothetical protein